MTRLVRFLQWLDARAQRKLGFVSSPLGDILGGVPVWLVTRLVAVAVVATAFFVYTSGVAERARLAENVRLTKLMVHQQVRVTMERRARDDRLRASIEDRDKFWQREIDSFTKEADALRAKLAAAPSNQTCWTPDTEKTIRDIVRRMNR